MSTVRNVLSDVNKNKGVLIKGEILERGHGQPKVKSYGITVVRKMIQYAHLRGELVTIPKLFHWLNEYNIPVTQSSLYRALLRNGFSYGHASRRSSLKEREDVIVRRRQYLANIRNNRDKKGRTIRPEVYLDETFVNVNHRKKFTWNEEGSLVNVPSGVGARLIIVDAIIQDDRRKKYGWVDGAHIHFKSGLRTGDYHGAMNTENFTKWITDKLLPNIPKNSFIIFDNASYHNTFTEDTFPQIDTKKSELKHWLELQNIPFDDWMLKSGLYDLCRKHAPPPKYIIDQLAAKFGCEILRTPPYHPELQPIENIWGITKEKIAKTQTGDYTMKSLKERIMPAFEKITPEIFKNTFSHVKKEENHYWDVDEKIDEMS